MGHQRIRGILAGIVAGAALLVGAPAAQAEAPAELAAAAPAAAFGVESISAVESSFNFAAGAVTTITTETRTISRSTAELACPTAHLLDIVHNFGDGYNVHSTFRGIYCQVNWRIDWGWAGSGTPGVLGWYYSSSYGNPAIQVFSGFKSTSSPGTIVAQYIANYIPEGTLANWDNVYCAIPCVARMKGRADKPGTDYHFILWKQFTTSAESAV
jgi:hypothetical protein